MTRVAQNLGSSYKLEIKVIWDIETWILLGLLETWGHLTLPFLGGLVSMVPQKSTGL